MAVTFVDAFARDLRWERACRRSSPASFRLEELRRSLVEAPGGRNSAATAALVSEVDMSDSICADDHDTQRPVTGRRQVRLELAVVRELREIWRTKVNTSKSSVMVEWSGPGSRRSKHLAPKAVLLTNAGGPCQWCDNKGALDAPARRIRPLLLQPLRGARKQEQPRGRFQKCVLGNKCLPVHLRMHFSRFLASPVLLCGLEVYPQASSSWNNHT